MSSSVRKKEPTGGTVTQQPFCLHGNPQESTHSASKAIHKSPLILPHKKIHKSTIPTAAAVQIWCVEATQQNWSVEATQQNLSVEATQQNWSVEATHSRTGLCRPHKRTGLSRPHTRTGLWRPHTRTFKPSEHRTSSGHVQTIRQLSMVRLLTLHLSVQRRLS